MLLEHLFHHAGPCPRLPGRDDAALWRGDARQLPHQRQSHDERYREILGHQREDRAELRWLQDTGLDTASFFNELAVRKDARIEISSGFIEAAHEITAPRPVNGPDIREGAIAAGRDEPVEYTPRDVDVDVGGRVAGGAVSFLDALFVDLTNLGSARPEPMSREERADMFREAAETTLKQHQQHAREEEDESWRQRQRVFGE